LSSSNFFFSAFHRFFKIACEFRVNIKSL
jgi:hypothetical protein